METCECVCAAISVADQIQIFMGGVAFMAPLIAVAIVVRAARAGAREYDV